MSGIEQTNIALNKTEVHFISMPAVETDLSEEILKLNQKLLLQQVQFVFLDMISLDMFHMERYLLTLPRQSH